MCMICVHYKQEKLTLQEARRNLIEMRETLEPEHVAEVEDMLWPYHDTLPMVDEDWGQLDFLSLLGFPHYDSADDEDIICSD